MKSDNKTQAILTQSKITLCVALAIFVGCIAAYACKFGIGLWPNANQWGQMGDYFGGVLNPVIAFCALILLFNTIRLQRIELANATDALNLTVDNSKAQLKHLENEAKKADIDKFLKIQRDTLNNAYKNILCYEQVDGLSNIRNITFQDALNELTQNQIAGIVNSDHIDKQIDWETPQMKAFFTALNGHLCMIIEELKELEKINNGKHTPITKSCIIEYHPLYKFLAYKNSIDPRIADYFLENDVIA